MEATTEPADCGYLFIRTWTATDDCNNSTTATQIITVTDTTAPEVVTQPQDITVECGIDIPDFAPEFIDQCDESITISYSENSDGEGCDYYIVRTWTATDDCGNGTTVSQQIHVVDTTAPEFNELPEELFVNCGDIPAPASPVATDVCDADVLILFDETETSGCPYTINRTWTAIDDCGNLSTFSQVLFVSDNQAPSLVGVPEDQIAYCGAIPAPASVTAADNCYGNLPVVFDETIADQPCGYLIIRTWAATDPCGNEASATQIITVLDNQAPVISGSDIEVTLECNQSPEFEQPTATDDCSEFVLDDTFTVVPGACANGYSWIYTWVATDACGNSSTRTYTYHFIDSTPPQLAGVPADVEVSCNEVPSAAFVTAVDNCDANVDVAYTEYETGECPKIITRTWTAVDDCGNSVTASQIITVVDETAPLIFGVPEDTTIECTEEIAPAFPFAIDNCDAEVLISLEAGTVPMDCGYLFVRTWTAIDNCGNTATAVQTITVVDTQAPVIVVPADITVNCNEVPVPGDVTAIDACDNEV
ncbi:MAG: hypothetical protein JNM00_13560, partial [Flavobacteriales bacterium]|nr:hypothetical protein [Flavobacteriales bacterium]